MLQTLTPSLWLVFLYTYVIFWQIDILNFNEVQLCTSFISLIRLEIFRQSLCLILHYAS